jgi:hypothetical protein
MSKLAEPREVPEPEAPDTDDDEDATDERWG